MADQNPPANPPANQVGEQANQVGEQAQGAPQAQGSPLIPGVNFEAIPAGKWPGDDNAEYVRILALRQQLDAIRALWAGIINAQDADAVTAAYNALKADTHKIVNLNGIVAANVVFPGGSRKKRHSKNKKNASKHNKKHNKHNQ